MPLFNCPNCGQQMRPVPVVWKQGTSYGTGASVGGALVGRHLVPFMSGSSSTTQTNFAGELAPPEQRQPTASLLLVAILLGLPAIAAAILALWLSIEPGGGGVLCFVILSLPCLLVVAWPHQ